MNTLKTALDSADLSSRGKRRKAAVLAAGFLGRIRDAEEAYLMRVPDNLQSSDACLAAEGSVSFLEEAIDATSSAYD